MAENTKIEEAFFLCESNLPNLPSKFKRWRTLYDYRSDWVFIEREEVKDKIAEQCMACDYLLSLHLWLKPGLVFKAAHRQLLIQVLASIYEGTLIDFLNKKARKMGNDKLARSLLGQVKIDKLGFYYLIDISRKGGLLDEYWYEYLTEVREIRNWIHLSKKKKNNIDLLKKPLEELIEDLGKFRGFIRRKYLKLLKKENIPF